jgi:hypothetical protein
MTPAMLADHNACRGQKNTNPTPHLVYTIPTSPAKYPHHTPTPHDPRTLYLHSPKALTYFTLNTNPKKHIMRSHLFPPQKPCHFPIIHSTPQPPRPYRVSKPIQPPQNPKATDSPHISPPKNSIMFMKYRYSQPILFFAVRLPQVITKVIRVKLIVAAVQYCFFRFRRPKELDGFPWPRSSPSLK